MALKTVLFLLFATAQLTRQAEIVVGGNEARERRLKEVCNLFAAPDIDKGYWGVLLGENSEIKGAVKSFHVKNECDAAKRITLTIIVKNVETQVLLYVYEEFTEKQGDTELRFICYMVESKFGDNNFFSAQCVEILEEAEQTVVEIKARITADLTNMLNYIIGRVRDSPTVEKVAQVIESHVASKDISSAKALLDKLCPSEGKGHHFETTDKTAISTPGKLFKELRFECAGVGVQLNLDVFMVDGHYIRVRVASPSSAIEFDWPVFDQKRFEEWEKDNSKKIEGLLASEFESNYRADFDAFLDSTLTVSLTEAEKLSQTQLTFPEFVSLLDKTLSTTAQREAEKGDQHLLHVSRLNFGKLNSRPPVQNLEDSQEGAPDASEEPTARRFVTYQPFDYFVYLTEEQRPGVVQFGKFFGEIDLSKMSLSVEGLYCHSAGIAEGCKVGSQTSPETVNRQVEHFHKSLVAKEGIYEPNDAEAVNFRPRNPSDYFPIEMAYSVDEIMRVLLVKVWQIDSGCFAGAIVSFKTQFFVLEYIVPFLDGDSTLSILGLLVDNVLDHYGKSVLDTHDETSKPTVYSLESVQVEVGKALAEAGMKDHVCANRVSNGDKEEVLFYYHPKQFGAPIAKDGQVDSCKEEDLAGMEAVLMVGGDKARQGFDIKLFLSHGSPAGLPLSTAYHINHFYPFNYGPILQSYLVYTLGLIHSKSGKRYEINKQKIAKMLQKQDVKSEGLRSRRVLWGELRRKMAKTTKRMEI